MKTINYYGIEIIRKWEGLEDGDPNTVNLDPYLCPSKVWTIGWGHALFTEGRMLRNNKQDNELVKKLFPIGLTYEQAEDLLFRDLNSFSLQLNNLITNRQLTNNAFSACGSLAFNIGTGNFAKSSVLRLVNLNRLQNAADNFWQWRRANGVILNGLVKRREEEKQLFLKPDTVFSK